MKSKIGFQKGYTPWNKGKSSWNRGKKLTEEHKKKLSESHKGIKHTPEHIRKFREKMIGHKTSEETKRKIGLANSISLKGHISWNKGKEFPQMKGNTNGFKKGMIPWSKGLKGLYPQKIREKMSEAKKRNPVRYWLGKKRPELGKVISEKALKRWSDPEFAKKMWKAFNRSPNNSENKLSDILSSILPNEYKYVGNGEFILGGKCPDFININGKKKLIELNGEYWHKRQNPQDRINYFRQYGFDTLIIWEKELKDKNLKEKIIQFNSSKKMTKIFINIIDPILEILFWIIIILSIIIPGSYDAWLK